MVDTEGPIEVASQRNERGEDRKVDLVVGKPARYDVVIGALQRREGVALVLRGQALVAWRYRRLSETCNREGEDYSLPDPQSFMMKKVPLQQ